MIARTASSRYNYLKQKYEALTYAIKVLEQLSDVKVEEGTEEEEASRRMKKVTEKLRERRRTYEGDCENVESDV